MSSPIRQWLEKLGLSQYSDRFDADDIDLDVLPSLSEQDLEKLGVSMGHRKKLLKAMAELGGAASSTVAPGTMAAAHTRPADQPEARKVVTILFADLAGSTALHERLDPESVRSFMESYYRSMRAAIEARGGTLVKFLGDGVMAAFGVPHVAEDDASRAVHAGFDMQQAFRALAREHAAIGLRVAINTGEVVVSADNTDVVGDPVNVAARLQQEARDGDVVLGESTRRLVATLVTLEPLGSFALKGRSEQVKAYRVVSLERPTGTATAAFVGRDDELARITAVYEAARATPAGRLAVLLGSPGLGKSRLIDEATRRLGDAASVVTAHCDAAGGATFAPVAEALREFFHVEAGASSQTVQAAIEAAIPATDAERTRIAGGIAALLAGSPASPEETFFVIRRLLAGLAAATPVVLVIDDLQWAEPLLLDLVEHLVQWGSGVPLLVLVGARPELRDVRSSLVTPGGLVADVVTLGGLDAGAAMRLAANVIGAADLPAAVAAKVLATSEGNPLFVGELVRMLVDEGAIERRGERWIVGANLVSLEMPPTIHALLAARIERLRPEERTVLERAAVVGRHFSRSAVAALLGRNGSELDARLEALRRAQLIERDTGWLLGEPVLRFHHVLIRDAAYRRLLKGTRAELHEQLADWIEAQVKDADEHEETIGWHLEQAHQHRRELGALGVQGKTLGERAAQHLAAAGRRALARDDLPVAAGLLGRAIDRLDSDDRSRADLALDWCEALLAAGDVGTAGKAIEELKRFIDAPYETPVLIPVEGPPAEGGSSGRAVENSPQESISVRAEEAASSQRPSRSPDRLRAWHTCFTGQLTVLTAPQALNTTADAVAAAAAELATLGDAAGEAKAHFVHATALARLGKVGACEGALDQALAAARRAGDRRRANAVLAGAPLAALWGPSPVTRASGRCLDVVRVLRITQGAPAVESVALSCQAVLEALRGRTEAARRMLAASRKMVEDLGIAHRLFEADGFAGRIAAMEGDTTTAEKLLRGAYEGLRDLGLGIDAARAGALLGRTLLAQNLVAEAEALSHQSEALAGDDLQAAIAWRGVRAEALARRGEHAAAVELAKAAVAIASATDALLDHADARMALAAALRTAGRGAEADAEERRAIELWEAKGATLLAERVRCDRERAAPTIPAAAPIAIPTAVRRRVRPNAATAMQNRFDAALAARDFAAIARQFREDHREIDHPTGATYGRDACIASLQRLFRSRDPHYQVEPLVTLGELLLLVHRRSGAAGTASSRYDVGAYENEAIQLFEVDASGLCRSAEVFAADHLSDAIARLYERYAELLPEGSERERAAATGRSMAAQLQAPDDVERAATVIAPDFESVDHRHLSTWSMRGGSAFLEHLRALQEVAAEVVILTRDVLALAPNALLTQRLHSGTERVGGGAYERPFLVLFATDADGRLARAEWFDSARDAEALGRFEVLVAGTEPKPLIRRRVRANAATHGLDRFEAALRARDVTALKDVFHESLQVVHHPTRATYRRREMLGAWRSVIKAERFEFRSEIPASLGGALALEHHFLALEGLSEDDVPGIGRAEFDEIALVEADDRGRWLHCEIFAADRLGAAIARLYERYAELLAEGPERERAAATARSVAVVAPGGFDRARYAEVFRSDVEIVDHKLLGLGTGVGLHTLFRSMAAGSEVADQVVSRPQDVLALTHDALLLRWLASGVGRESGGAFEWAFLRLLVFGADGCVARYELFDADCEAQALARFDELVGSNPSVSPLGTGRIEEGFPSAPFGNAASRSLERNARCWAARDWDGALAILSPSLRFDDRRRLMRIEIGYEDFVAQFRLLFDQPTSRWQETLIATRGERLALTRTNFEAEVTGGGGPLAFDEHLSLTEVDADGRWIACVTFDLEDLDAAYAELDARFEAGEASAYPRLTGALKTKRFIQARDWRAYAARLAPGFVYRDHRRLGWGTTVRDVATFIRVVQSTFDLAPDARYRDDHVRIAERGHLVRATLLGTRDGGAFENPMLRVAEVDESGRIRGFDTYDPEDLARALARFAELACSEEPAPDPFAEPFANAATRAVKRGTAALAARDWEAFASLMAPDFRHYDRTRVAQLETDGREWLASFRQLVEMTTEPPEYELLATRGERFALFTMLWRGAAGDVGPSEIDWRLIVEVNDRGEHTAVVVYDPDDVDAAYAELDARYEAAEGASTAGIPSRFTAGVTKRDWAALTALCSPELVEHDHRPVIGLEPTRGAEAWVQNNLRVYVELAPDTVFRTFHVRARERGWLVQFAWEGTRAGGRYEISQLAVVEQDDGDRSRMLRVDVYDLAQLDLARARLAELAAPAAAEPRFANAATATVAPVFAYMIAHDWPGFEQLFAERFRISDRRRVVQLDLDRDQYVAFTREIADGRAIRARSEIVATRGERLALTRSTFEFTDVDVGPSEVAFLLLTQVDTCGRIVAYVRWDLEDIEAAYAELDTRWAADGAAEHARAAQWVAGYLHAFALRDWPAMTALFTPDLVGENHRLVGWGTRQGPEGVVSTLQAQIELAPDTRERVDHVRTCDGAVLLEYAWHGTRDGGAFENLWLVLVELTPDGRACRADVWEPEQLDQARARFDEIAARVTAPAPFENAASRAWRAVIAVWRQRNVERFAALHPPALRYRDHRRLVQLDLERDGFLAFTRPLLEMHSTSASLDLLATRGERLALMRSTLEMADDSVGPSAIDSLLLIETDEHGEIVAYDRYDVDDDEAARAEILARWESGEGSQFHIVAWMRDHAALAGRRDWDAVAALYSPAVVGHDHRLVGWGTLRGRTDFMQSLRSMEALSPDARLRGDHTRACPRGSIMSNMWVGTRDGGAFESPFLAVSELDADGTVGRIDFYDPHHVERALSRFAEISANPPASPIDAFLKGHAVTTALESWRVFDTGADPDWDALQASCAPDMTFEDRQGFARLSGDRGMMIASLRERVASGARAERRLLGTAGDRIAVMRMLWTGGPADGRFEIEYVSLAQLDEAGLVIAIILFGPDDERAAQREAWTRWAAIEPVAAPWVELVDEFTEAWNGHDRARVRACFADDFVLEDHRHAGLGCIEGAEAYVDSIVVLWDLAPDQRLMFGWSWPVVERHGIVVTIRRQGTVPDGGPFETEHLALGMARNGRFTRVEFFEIDALDIALARFEELRPDPLRIPPNAVTRTWDRWCSAVAANDRDAIRGLYAPAYRFDDQRRLFRMSADLGQTLAGDYLILEDGWQPVRTLLATAGDRLALQHILWTTGVAGTTSEIEMLMVSEVDRDGRLVHGAAFDPDDRAAAFDEAHARFVASGAGSSPDAFELVRAWNAHDLARMRALLPDDFYLDDHRRTGCGRLDGADAYLASIAAMYQLSHDLRTETLYIVSVEVHGTVWVARWLGTNAEGGAFDAVYVCVGLQRDGRPAGLEIFEIEALDAALARLADLRPGAKGEMA